MTVVPSIRLLVVEDDEDSVVILRELLLSARHARYEIEWAATYDVALRILEEERHDLCLSDIHLGDGSGVELIGEARRKGIGLPFLLISGTSGNLPTDRTLIESGAEDFLEKRHLATDWLDRGIRNAIERHRFREQLDTQRRAAETSESRLRDVVESTLDGLVVIDPDGEVQFANSEARAHWLATIPQILSPSFAASPRGPYREVTVTGDRGESRVAEVRSTPLDWNGRPAQLLNIRDISARRALENQLRQAQKMEAIGQLTGGIAHDLNNILTVIRAGLGVVEVDAGETVREDLALVSNAADRAAALIRKLLAFGRRQTLEMRQITLHDLVTDFVRLARRVLPETIELEIDVPADATAIRADRGAMEQVLLNLLTNARDAMPNGGRLSIAARLRSTDDAGRGFGRVAIDVRDTGAGMDAATIEHIFEPFFSTKPEGLGSGLGLPMVYGIIQQHDGEITVHSTPGIGTTFSLLLPAVPAPSSAEPRASESPTSGGRETILLVEDEPEVRRLARRVLERHGYRVHEAANGVQALEQFDAMADAVHLVLTDIVMPAMGGIQLRDKLRARGSAVPILFSSGFAQDTSARLGDTPLLRKPWTAEQLLHAVRDLLDRRADRAGTTAPA